MTLLIREDMPIYKMGGIDRNIKINVLDDVNFHLFAFTIQPISIYSIVIIYTKG